MKRRGYGRIINLTSGIRDIPQLAPVQRLEGRRR